MGNEQRGMISKTAVIYPNVRLGANCVVEDYCIVGSPPAGRSQEELETIIGDNAVIRSHTVIYAGNHIGSGFQTGNKANVRELNEIGNDVSIGTMSVVEHHVTIGNGVRVHSQVFIPEYSVLEDECWLGPQVVLTNAKYPRSPEAKKQLKGVRICRAAVLGAHVTVLPGVVIGERAVIGAGSVVVHDVPARAVVAGNPAKQVNTIENLPYQK
jgi:acetyltransferase-like isoleucine patch superfamily enzyme